MATIEEDVQEFEKQLYEQALALGLDLKASAEKTRQWKLSLTPEQLAEYERTVQESKRNLSNFLLSTN